MQNGITIQVLHSDRGAEFLATKFQEYLKVHGTVQKLTIHDTPEHNGNAECAHCPLLNSVHTMLLESGLPR